jgi:hypothetical protein
MAKGKVKFHIYRKKKSYFAKTKKTFLFLIGVRFSILLDTKRASLVAHLFLA